MMDLREQVLQFRNLIEKQGGGIDDFELNVDGDIFRALIAGGAGQFEVRCRTTGIVRVYLSDGTPAWLAQLTADLECGRFAKPG